jgi:V/A-type H+-transporting ATPase subunit C
MTQAGDSIKYGFAVGRVMVLRTRLLSRATYERLLDAPTFQEQRRVLSETHFGRFIEGAVSASDVEVAVDESLRDLYEEFLERSELPPAVVGYFRAPYDFAALRGALKARALGDHAPAPSVFLGRAGFEGFDEPASLPGALGRTARDVLGAEEPLDAEAIDAAVDRAMFAELMRLARESRVGFLGRLASREADAVNAKVLLRAAIAGRSPDSVRDSLVPGGTWDADSAADLVSRPMELAQAVVIARVLAAASPDELLELTRLDVLVDAASARLAREAAHGPIGPEPVLAYVLQRRAEAATVRAVLVGRLAGLPRDVVASRLREAAS